MRRKSGGTPGRHRTLVPVRPTCPVCRDEGEVTVVLDDEDLPATVACPHCGPPHLPISTYYNRGNND